MPAFSKFKTYTMKFLNYILFLSLALFFNACIQDDFIEDEIDPILSIASAVDTIEINTTYQFEAKYLNNIGIEEVVPTSWSSSDPTIIEINDTGLANAKAEGQVSIGVSYNDDGIQLEDIVIVNVGDKTSKVDQITNGSIRTTSSYKLEGDFMLSENDSGIQIQFADNYSASTALPGLYVYLSNNKSSIGNAFEIGKVEVFNGEHIYDVPGVAFSDYKYLVYFCKPFNVKVGDGEL